MQVGEPRVRWVPGFYNVTLTRAFAKRAAPALFVDMDCDLYSSTYQALDWLLSHKLVSPARGVHSMLSYDDWGNGGRNGQQAAHRKLMLAHNATAKLLTSFGVNAWHPEYYVTNA